jgi:hypothetical protein
MEDRTPHLILDYRTPDGELNRLSSMGFSLVPSDQVPTLYEAVDGHPDLQFINVRGKLIAYRDLQKDKKSLLEDLGACLTLGKSSLALPYPQNVPYNALLSPDLFIHRLDATDPLLKNEINGLENLGEVRLVDVRQGYSRCSCAYVGNDSYVTEDEAMAKTLMNLGKKVFYRKHSNIYLKGFDYGFIGGALSLLPIEGRDLLIITGDLHSYFYGDELKGFLQQRNIPFECIGKGKMMDRGSIICF